MTARSAREARRSLVVNGIFLKPLGLIFPILGVLLFSYYQVHPETASLMRIPDDALPVFVAQVLPSGIRGLIIAAVMSAVMTSLDSGLSALSACVQVDYVRRWRRYPLSDRSAVSLARILVLIWGLFVITGALLVRLMGKESNIIQILNTVMYPFAGVLLGMFLLGLLTARANGTGALIGSALGFFATLLAPLGTAMGGVLQATGWPLLEPLWRALFSVGQTSSFFYGVVGTLATFIFGYLMSLFFRSPSPQSLRGLTHALPDSSGPIRS